MVSLPGYGGPVWRAGQARRRARRKQLSVFGDLGLACGHLDLAELDGVFLPNELYVSVNTVKAHARHVYAKLGAHTRGEAVERARVLRLLAPAARPRDPAITRFM